MSFHDVDIDGSSLFEVTARWEASLVGSHHEVKLSWSFLLSNFNGICSSKQALIEIAAASR